MSFVPVFIMTSSKTFQAYWINICQWVGGPSLFGNSFDYVPTFISHISHIIDEDININIRYKYKSYLVLVFAVNPYIIRTSLFRFVMDQLSASLLFMNADSDPGIN